MGIETLLDRELQRAILETLAARYPYEIDLEMEMPKWHEDEDTIYANLYYLRQHGLVDMTDHTHLGGERFIQELAATHKGMDFLMDDGGLSAILGVVTVKLHDETIQALLASKVEASDLPPEQKQTLIGQIRELRGEAAKHLVTKIIDYGITKGPEAMHWLSEAVQKAAS